ncbi:transposase [Streptomyces sp. NPDC054866]
MLQFMEGLSDRQAAVAAVRARLDWKILPGLELTDLGFDFSVLSEFRALIVALAVGRSCGVRPHRSRPPAELSRTIPRQGTGPRMADSGARSLMRTGAYADTC